VVVGDVVVEISDAVTALSAILASVLIVFPEMQSDMSVHVALVDGFVIAMVTGKELFRYVVDAVHVLSQVITFHKVFPAFFANDVAYFRTEFLVVDGYAMFVVSVGRVKGLLAILAINASTFFCVFSHVDMKPTFSVESYGTMGANESRI
jgi:hypothetical protein